ncbi:MAG: hypothetical protein ACK5LL_03490 [Suipraeoptans sp.]
MQEDFKIYSLIEIDAIFQQKISEEKAKKRELISSWFSKGLAAVELLIIVIMIID